MTNGEKFKEVFQTSQIDDCDLNVYVWLPIHDAIEIPVEWWNAEYKEPTTKSETLVSLEVYKQVAKERDIAIQQLHELGYVFGQKIEPSSERGQKINKSAMMLEIYMAGVNMCGEYRGCWVRFKEIEKIVDKYVG